MRTKRSCAIRVDNLESELRGFGNRGKTTCQWVILSALRTLQYGEVGNEAKNKQVDRPYLAMFSLGFRFHKKVVC
jgi:hypothetical protein